MRLYSKKKNSGSNSKLKGISIKELYKAYNKKKGGKNE